MTILEKRRKRAALIEEARTILNTAEKANRSLTAEENTAWDGKLAEAERMKADIEREERQIQLEAETAIPLSDNAERSAATITSPQAKRTPGQGFINCVRAVGNCRGDLHRAAHFAEHTLHDGEVARALAASTGAAGGFLVPSVLSQEIIEYLRPASVVRASGPRILPMENGNLSLPKMTGGATATYIGENTNIGKTEPTFGQVRLTAKKLAALVPISNDLIRFANPQTDAVIRQDLVKAMAQAEDLAFIRGDGSQFSPKGIKNWALAANVFHANGTVNIATITTDLGTAISNLLTANVMISPDSAGWLMSPRTFTYLKTLRTANSVYAFPELQMNPPQLMGFQIRWTSQIPINLSGSQSEIYFVNFTDAVIGESMNLLLDVSSEAAYYDGSSVVAAFSQDQTVIRVIAQHDFAMRYDQAISVIDQVTY